jgi:tetratricopeptide (TPR) repeat protein
LYYLEKLPIKEKLCMLHNNDYAEFAYAMNSLHFMMQALLGVAQYKTALKYAEYASDIENEVLSRGEYTARDECVALFLQDKAEILYALGCFEDAIVAHTHAYIIFQEIHRNDGVSSCLSLKAISYVALDRMEDAQMVLQEAKRICPFPAYQKLLVNWVALQAAREKQAIPVGQIMAYFKEILDAADTDDIWMAIVNKMMGINKASIHSSCAGFLFLQGFVDEAKRQWEEAIVSADAHVPIFLNVLSLGTVLPCLAPELRALRLFHTTPALLSYCALTIVHYRDGQQEKSSIYLQKLIDEVQKLTPFYTHYSLLGHAYFRLGLFQEARETFGRAATLYEATTSGGEYTLAKVNQHICTSRLRGVGCEYQERLATRTAEQLEHAATAVQRHWRGYVVRSRIQIGEAVERS